MMVEPFPDRRRAILTINRHCLGAGLFAAIAWTIWPSSPEWWGLGVVSIILAMQVPASLIAAIRAFLALRQRERAIAAYAAQGAPIKSAAMASTQSLIDAGMIDDDA